MAEPIRATMVSAGEVSHVIVRACADCRSPRRIGEPCGGCGNPNPPEVTHLGVVAATYRNPLRQAWWTLAGRHLADRRIRRANRRTKQLQDEVG